MSAPPTLGKQGKSRPRWPWRARAAACAIGLAAVSLGAAAMAQTAVPSKPDVALTDKARDLYNEGRELYVAGKVEQAHASFLAAWALKRHWQIAGMLGECELRLGKHRDAAEHLAFALRAGAAQAKPDEISAMRASFAQARKRVGELVVRVDRVGAEVLVDGAVVARTPIEDPIFADPGDHEVGARVEEREAVRAKVKAEAGGTHEVALSFTVTAQPAGTGAPATPTARSKSVPDSGPTTSGAESRPLWPVYVGAGVAAVGLGIGIGYTLAANGKDSDREDLIASLGGPNGCAPGTIYGAECARIRELDDDASGNRGVALGGFVVGGVAAAGTLVYLLWPRGETTGASSMRVTPLVGHGRTGVSMMASF